MTKGVFLCAWGKRGYAFAAYNLAYSIKHYNPELPIVILCDNTIHENIDGERKKVFDQIIPIPDSFKPIDPCNLKTSIYDFLPFDLNLFLDVDGVALKSVLPAFDELEKGYYFTHVIDTHTIAQGNIIPNMIWAYAEDIWSKYGLAHDAVLPCTNSSLQLIKKCDEAKELFAQVRENFLNPIPVNQLRTPWGGGQPDELYLNIALAQKGLSAKTEKEYLFLGNTLDPRSLSKLQQDLSILSLFGHKNMTRARYRDWYDKLLIEYHRKDNMNHAYKSHLITGDKHANAKAKLPERLRAVKQPRETAIQEEPLGDFNKYKILLKFPTRSRPEKFLTCLSKALELANDKENIKVLVSYDSDDKTMTPEVIEKAMAMGNVTCISGISKNKIHAVNRDMEQSGEWDILVLLSDDMECEFKGWDDLIRSKFTARQDGVLHFNDGYRAATLMTLAVMDRKYYDRFGYIYHPDYKMLFCDNEQMEVAKKLGRHRYFASVLFRHKMAANGFPQDELHKFSESHWDEDMATYKKRRARNFA